MLRAAELRDVWMPVSPAPGEARSHELWTELHGRMRAFVGRRIADPDAADDVAQDVLLRLHRHLEQLRDHDRLDALAYAIARNAITDHYRAAARRRDRAGGEPPPLDAARTDDDPSAEFRAGLAACLAPLVDRLDERQREALLLTDLGELTQAEAAARLGLSVPGMKSRVQRARAALARQLSSCCAVRLDAARQIGEVEKVGPCACSGSPEPDAEAVRGSA